MDRMIRAIVVCVCLAQFAPPVVLRADPSGNAKSDSTLNLAMRALDRGDVKGARDVLSDRNAEISRPDELLVRGRAFLVEGRGASARRSLQSAIKIRPRHAEQHYWLGRVYEADAAHALAAQSFQRAYSLGLGTCDLHLHWASALAAADVIMGDVRQQKWNDEFSDRPAVGTFAFEGIVARHVRGKPEVVIVAPRKSAIFQIHKALQADGTRAEAILLAGELWANMNEAQLAINRLRTAAKSLKGNSLARCQMKWAEACLSLGRLDSYLDHTKTHMELSGGIDTIKLATCYELAAREASARGLLKKQIRYLTFSVESQSTPARLINLADALLVAQRHDDAHRYLTQAMELKPTRAEQVQIKQRMARTSYLTSPASAR